MHTKMIKSMPATLIRPSKHISKVNKTVSSLLEGASPDNTKKIAAIGIRAIVVSVRRQYVFTSIEQSNTDIAEKKSYEQKQREELFLIQNYLYYSACCLVRKTY